MNSNVCHDKQNKSACSRTSIRKKYRNSSIELLRIIAMFMILMHHFIVHNGYDVENLP